MASLDGDDASGGSSWVANYVLGPRRGDHIHLSTPLADCVCKRAETKMGASASMTSSTCWSWGERVHACTRCNLCTRLRGEMCMY